MKIRLCQSEVENEIDSCMTCAYYESGDSSIGLNKGCTHPILYDEDGNIIDEIDDMIVECLNDPNHCILMVRSNFL